MMKKSIISLVAIVMSMTALCQEVPQFTSNNFDGWIYNNPGIELNSGNIASGRIVLYVDKQNNVLSLISPVFGCQGMDSIAAQVDWFTRNFRDPDFVLSLTALTIALDDAQGTPIDSVTCTPTATGTSTHELKTALAVPAGVDSIRIRMVGWQGNVVSSGAVRRAVFQASTASQQQPWGDVNGDGMVNVADVTWLIQQVLNSSMDDSTTVCDINHDEIVNVADVTRLIAIVLSGE